MVCPFVGMSRVRFSKTLSLNYMLRELEENAYVFLFVIVWSYSFVSVLIWFHLMWICNVNVRHHMMCSSLWEVLTLCPCRQYIIDLKSFYPNFAQFEKAVLGPGAALLKHLFVCSQCPDFEFWLQIFNKISFRWAEGILKLFFNWDANLKLLCHLCISPVVLADAIFYLHMK